MTTPFNWSDPVTVLAELQLPGLDQLNARNAKHALAAAFWSWFEQHREDVVFSTKLFGFVRVEIKAKQLEPVFIRIFGGR